MSCSVQQKQNLASRDIVIVNCGVYDRLGIANMLEVISDLNPKVIAVDINFAELKNHYQDSLLIARLSNCDNLVMSSIIDDYQGDTDTTYSELTGTIPEFLTNAKIGFTNAVLEDDSVWTLKRFSFFEKINDWTMYHFAVRTAMSFDSLKTIKYLKDKPKIIEVKYKGDEKVFKVFSYKEVLGKTLNKRDLEGKIVLLGYLGPFEGYKGPDEDKFFSPLNKGTQPLEPDMYGVVYLANVVTQILD